MPPAQIVVETGFFPSQAQNAPIDVFILLEGDGKNPVSTACSGSLGVGVTDAFCRFLTARGGNGSWKQALSIGHFAVPSRGGRREESRLYCILGVGMLTARLQHEFFGTPLRRGRRDSSRLYCILGVGIPLLRMGGSLYSATLSSFPGRVAQMKKAMRRI